MNASFRHILWKCTLPLVLLVLSSASVVAQHPQVTGIIRNAANAQPVQASVVLYAETSTNDKTFTAVEKAATDAYGRYFMTVKPNTPYKIAVYPWDVNYATTYYRDASDLQSAAVLVFNTATSEINFDLHAIKTNDNGVRGRVQNTKGEAIDAMVVLQSVNSSNSQAYTVATDKQQTGSFVVKNMAPGQYSLYVVPSGADYASGYYRQSMTTTYDVYQSSFVSVQQSGFASPEPVVIVDTKANNPINFSVTGLVVDEFKQPLANVLVNIFDASGNNVNGKKALVSAADGTFSSTISAGAGSYMLTAQLKGYDDAYAKIFLDEKNAVASVVLQLTSNDQTVYDNGVSGRVQDAKDQAVIAKIAAYRVLADGTIMANGSEVTTASAANDGSFLLKNLRPGSYVLFASPANSDLAAGYYLAGTTATNDPMLATVIQVEEKGVNAKPYVIVLEKDTRVYTYDFYAVVVDENQNPLDGVQFSAVDEAGNSVLLNQLTSTDARGYVHLQFPGAGTYVLSASKEGYQDALGTIVFNSAQWAQKAFIVLQKTNGVKGGENAKIVAGVNDEVLGVESLYPQPANDMVSFRVPGNVSFDALAVYNMQGTLQFQQSLAAPTTAHQLQIGSLSAGCYELRLLSGSVLKATTLFIKQ